MRTRYYRAWLLYVRVKTSKFITVCIHDKSMAHVACDSGGLWGSLSWQHEVESASRLRSAFERKNADQFLGASNFCNFAPDRARASTTPDTPSH